MIILTATVCIAIYNTTLGSAITVKVCNLIDNVTVLNGHWIWVNANSLLEADTLCRALIEQIAKATVGYILSRDGRHTILINGVVRIEAILDTAESATEESTCSVKGTYLACVIAVPYLSVAVSAVISPTVEYRSLIVAGTGDFAEVDTVVYLEVSIYALTCANKSTCHTAYTCYVSLVHTIKDLALKVCLFLQSTGKGGRAITAGNGAALVDDEILDNGITTNPSEESLVICCSVDNHTFDTVELTVECSVELTFFITADRCVCILYSLEIDIGSQNSRSRCITCLDII